MLDIMVASDELAFLTGGGEAGLIMRTQDWSASPLGDPAEWPQSLRSVVGLLLSSKFPMFVAWGSELGFLYNDAYAEILGAKHPAAMGARFETIWAEIWPDILPLVEAARAGESIYRENLPLVMNRRGFDEQTWFTFSYSPVRDESGHIAGMFCAVAETTAQVMSERRREFRIALEERLGGVTEARSVTDIAVETLGRHLGANRVGYAEVLEDDETIVLESCFADGVEPLSGRFTLVDFGADSIARQREGSMEVSDDVQADERQVQATWSRIQTRAFASIPLIRNERLAASLYVNFREPHRWTADELALIEETAARTWDAVERARAEAQLRTSEARFRVMADAVPQIVWVTDPEGRAEFFNRHWYDYTGVERRPASADEVASDFLHPDDAERTLAAFEHARRTGAIFTVEHRIRSKTGEYRWFLVRGEPKHDPVTGELEGWFGASTDIHDRKTAEEALQESEERFRLMADSSPALIWVSDADANVVFANQRYQEIFGHPADEMHGEGWRKIVHPDDLEDHFADFLAAMNKQGRFKRVTRVVDRDGQLRWLHCEGVPRYGSDGAFAGYVGVNLDITDAKRSEAELREREEQLRLATEAAEIGLWDLDPRSESLFWPPRVKAMFGISADRPISMADFYAGLHPEDADATSEAFAAAVDPKRRALYDVEYRTVGKEDRVVRWVAAKGRAIFDASGNCTRVIGTAIDITARKMIEEQLRELNETLEARVAERTAELGETERRFRGIFNSALQFMALLAPDGLVVEVNETALAWSEIEPKDIVGKPFWSAAPMRENPALQSAIRAGVKRAAAGQTVREEHEMRGAGEVRAFVDFSLKPVFGTDGKPVWLVAEGRDITELKRAQDALRQSQKMEAVGQLTGGIAHDFNNLLGAVVGSFDLIRRKPADTERVKRWAENGMAAAERGAKLTGQLLAFSRAQRLEKKPVVLTGLVEGMLDLLERTLGPMVRLKLDLAGNGSALSDPTQLEMAVLNLAINARDAMPDGGDLTISTGLQWIGDDAELSPGEYVELAVSDTGIGMPPEVIARAFDPFFTTKGVGKGTGLGLSQVYGVARQTGGTARIESRAGEGTTVRIFLPTTSPAPHPDAEAGNEAPARTRVSATVLVVDDDPDIRRVLVDLLEALGYGVTEAADGPSGLAELTHSAPDLLMVDFAMPGMNGAEVAKAARELRPDLPIVFASGYADTAAIEKSIGPDAVVLRKPFRVDDLQSVLGAMLV